MFSLPFFLLALLDESDRAFMEKLYTDYGLLMYHQARQLCRSDADAQDAVSSALLALMKKISFLRTLSCNKLKAYSVITVKHCAIDHYRHLQKEDVFLQEEDLSLADASRPDDRLMEQAGVEQIKQAILMLPKREQDVLMRTFFLREKEEEIAQSWQVRPVTVRVTLSRARNRLRSLLMERRETDV